MTDKVSLIIPEEDEDYLRCLDYVKEVEMNNVHPSEWIKDYEVTERTMQRWKARWIESGLLPAVRRQVAQGPIQDLQAARVRGFKRFPKVMERWFDIAEKSESDKVASDAAAQIWDRLIAPLLSDQPQDGMEEAEFIKGRLSRKQAFDPMAISRPRPYNRSNPERASQESESPVESQTEADSTSDSEDRTSESDARVSEESPLDTSH